MATTFLASLPGCRTATQSVTNGGGYFRAPAPSTAESTTNHLIPPPPAPENLKLGMSATPPAVNTVDVPPPRLLDPSSLGAHRGPPPIAAATAPLTPPTAALGPELVLETPPESSSKHEPALEARLSALEAECHEKLAALDALETQYQQQSQELTQVRQQLDSSQHDVASLTELVGSLQQRDVASLEQLSQTLDGLLETTSEAAPTEAN